jgi:mannose-1-phosphate guanylyltransferase
LFPTCRKQGYGYIERKGDDVIYLGKPNQVSAWDFIAKWNFSWNSEMFCFAWSFGRIESLILKYIKKSKMVWENNIN